MKKKIFSTLLLVAFALASTSMFISCKDYEDDINANTDRINALKSSLESALAQCKSDCQAAHATFATKTELGETNKAIEALKTEIAKLATADALQEALDRIKALEDAQITQADLDELATKVAGINEEIARAFAEGGYAKISDVEAADQNLQKQIDVLNAFKESMDKLDFSKFLTADALANYYTKDEINKLIEGIKTTDFSNDINDLKKQMDELSKKVNEMGSAGPNINVTQFLTSKTLTSLTLKPEFYTAGIECIEVPALYYQPIINIAGAPYAKGTISDGSKAGDEGKYRDGNGYGEAYYYYDKSGKFFGGQAPYIFDQGANAPKVIVPVTSWADAKTKYGSGYDFTGEPENATWLKAYRDIIADFKNFKTAKVVPAVTAEYHLSPSTANIEGAELSFFCNTDLVVDQVESKNTGYGTAMGDNSTKFATPVEGTFKKGSENNVINNGILSVNLNLRGGNAEAWEQYVEDLAYYADGVDGKGAVNFLSNATGAGVTYSGSKDIAAVRDSINFIALQVTYPADDNNEARSITSDYAAVVPALVHVNALADNKPESAILKCFNIDGWPADAFNSVGGHMYKTAADAIDNAPTHSVAYNDKIDIMPFIETHFSYIGAKSQYVDYDHTMSAKIFKQFGLKYEFELVDYLAGTNVTSESAHATITPNANPEKDFGYESVIVTPKSVITDAKGKYNGQHETTTREAIDREPLLKVILKTANGDIIEVGYMKLLITDVQPDPISIDIPDNYWMNCGDEGGVTWVQIEDILLGHVGSLGITKQEFEAEYVLDTYGNDAETNSNHSGVRFIATENNGKWSYAKDTDPLGRVRYTNFVAAKYDRPAKETNVLLWGINMDGTEDARVAMIVTGKKTAAEAREALIANKGVGYEGTYLTTTVRFIKKSLLAENQNVDFSAIYVTLRIPGEQVHFAYGEIGNKDLSHWYILNGYKHGSDISGTEATDDAGKYTNTKAIEVLENVPSPAEWAHYAVGYDGKVNDNQLTEQAFERSLLKNFIEEKVLVNNLNPYFTNYANANNNVSFRFVLPQKGKNAEFDAVNNTWTVSGYSAKHKGETSYTLHLSDADNDGNMDEIRDSYNNVIVKLTGANHERIEYQYNDAADDILNFAGRRDDLSGLGLDRHDGATNAWNSAFFGENQTSPAYLSNKEAFTAYIEMFTDDTCFDLLLANRFFNAKFERPLNAWPKKTAWTDALNKTETIYASDLIQMVDWRDYVIDFQNNVVFTEDVTTGYAADPSRKPYGKYITWNFYGIDELYIPYDEILTDHALDKADRDAIAGYINAGTLTQADIAELAYNNKTVVYSPLMKAASVPALYNDTKASVSGAQGWLNTTMSKKYTNGPSETKITYTNNGGNVQLFHLFVPIYVKYLWGEHDAARNYGDYFGGFKPYGRKIDNNIDETTPKQFNPSTLKVWAVITIDQTTGSGNTN